MKTITKSVGNKGDNQESDVRIVQALLNKSLGHLTPLKPLVADGDAGPITIGMIIEFQYRIMGFKNPDGRIDAGGKTFDRLVELTKAKPAKPAQAGLYDQLLLHVQGIMKQLALIDDKPLRDAKHTMVPMSKKLTEQDFQRAATALGAEVAAIKAVARVESYGGGFLKDGRPKILFEGHWFSNFTKNKYDTSNPTLSYKKWTKKHYKGGAAEYERYNAAKALNKEAAQKSTSWGKFQIMGFNYKKAGYASVDVFVEDMKKSEGAQLLAFINFVKSKKLDVALKAKDWATFAKGYNGKEYAKNKYDIRLKQAYNAYSAKK